MNSSDIQLSSQILSAAITAATGETPTISTYPDYAELTFTQDQASRLSDKLLQQLNDNSPSPIRVNIAPVVLPAIVKKYGLYVAGAIILIYFLGRKKFPI